MKIFFLIILIILPMTMQSCVIPYEKRPIRLPRKVDLKTESIYQKYLPYFSVGVALEPKHLETVKDLLDTQFNRLTCENAMKMRMLQPQEGVFTFENADKIADYARVLKKTMTGHALLWHRETPEWVYSGLTPGTPETIEALKTRLKKHIDKVIPRYADVVDNWDVVNEAISDNPKKIFRTKEEGSMWHEYFGGTDEGGREYVYWAFKYAKEALERHSPGSSKGRLYYNDYNVNLKLDRILDLLVWMRDEKGLKIDGVGMQAHVNMTWPSVQELQRTMDAIIAEGFTIKISELDVTLYSDYTADGTFFPQEEVIFDTALEMAQAKRYGELFELFRKNHTNISSVTLWGVADDHTWLRHEPVKGRDNRPLLFSVDHTPKAAVNAILNF